MSRSPLFRRLTICVLTLALAACATQAPPPPADTAAPKPSVPVKPTPGTNPLPDPYPPMPLEQARAAFVQQTATKYGIEPAHIEAMLAKAQMREPIIKAMSRPAEAKPWRDYRPIFITQGRIDGGRAFLAQHRDRLARVEQRFGVPAEIIVSIIGVETSYGANTGSYPVIDALYTLGFAYPRSGDPAKADREARREAFFRNELGMLFALGKAEGFDVGTLTGSYAGAMGWGQFMPSSYLEFAVDGDGDGRRDLFTNADDVFASIANYFVAKGGWTRGEPVTVRAIAASGAQAPQPESLEPAYPLADLVARGFRPLTPVPATQPATLLTLDGVSGPEHWLAFGNFYAITRYNISKHYAMAVFQLAEAIAGRENPLAATGARAGRGGA